MTCIHMGNEAIFTLELNAVSAAEAYPILKTMVFFEKMMSPSLLCGKKKVMFGAVWQDTTVWAKIFRDMLSIDVQYYSNW